MWLLGERQQIVLIYSLQLSSSRSQVSLHSIITIDCNHFECVTYHTAENQTAARQRHETMHLGIAGMETWQMC